MKLLIIDGSPFNREAFAHALCAQVSVADMAAAALKREEDFNGFEIKLPDSTCDWTPPIVREKEPWRRGRPMR